MDKLERFGEQISSYEKLRIKEAKDLYEKAISVEDKELKKHYMDKIVLGTMYYVFNFIKHNGLHIFENGSYDMDDIINSFVEIWIKRINNGALLNANRYADILNYSFIKEVCSNLIGGQIIMPKELFWNLLYEFIKLKNSGRDFDFKEEIDNNSHITNYLSWELNDRLFGSVYDNLNFDKTDDLVMTKSRMKEFLDLFAYSGLFDTLSEDMVVYNMEDEIVTEYMYKLFLNEVDRVLTNDRDRDIIYQRFGLDGERIETLEKIGNRYGFSRQYVRYLEAMALRKLRRLQIRKDFK